MYTNAIIHEYEYYVMSTGYVTMTSSRSRVLHDVFK